MEFYVFILYAAHLDLCRRLEHPDLSREGLRFKSERIHSSYFIVGFLAKKLLGGLEYPLRKSPDPLVDLNRVSVVLISLFDVLFPDSPDNPAGAIRRQSQPLPHYAHGSAMGFFVTLTFH
jgi:hypothetical protein